MCQRQVTVIHYKKDSGKDSDKKWRPTVFQLNYWEHVNWITNITYIISKEKNSNSVVISTNQNNTVNNAHQENSRDWKKNPEQLQIPHRLLW